MKRRGKKRAVAVFGLGLLLIAAGCGSKGEAGGNAAMPADAAGVGANAGKAQGQLKIQTSLYPIYEFTQQVAGDLADVGLLVPGGVEPHDWEPTPQDIKKIAESDLLIVNGAGLESWMEQVQASLSGDKPVIVEASQGLALMEGAAEEEHEHEHAQGEGGHTDEAEANHAATGEHSHDEAGEVSESHGHGHDHGGLDPHVWLSPALAIQEVRSIEAALSKAAPEHAGTFKQNADAYVAKLEQLNREFADGLANAKRRDFVTQHAAFGYLAREYGLTQVPIAGLSPEQEPSAEQMTDMVKFAKEHQVKTIFFETLVSSKVAETIAREIEAGAAVLNPIEGLTAEDEANGRDYLALMRQNLEALKTALNE